MRIPAAEQVLVFDKILVFGAQTVPVVQENTHCGGWVWRLFAGLLGVCVQATLKRATSFCRLSACAERSAAAREDC